MQYVVCKFAASKRGYTYENAGASVAVGDRVLVQGPRDEGKVTVEVTEVDVAPPPFACKPVLGLAPPKELSLMPPPKSDPLSDEVSF